MNIVIFGIGTGMEKFTCRLNRNDNINIVCYADNSNKVNSINGKKVILPHEIRNYSYDYIIICSQYYKEIEKQLIEIGIEEKRILSYFYYWEDREYYENKNKIISRYIRKGNRIQRNETLDYIEKKKQYNNYYNQKIDKWSEINDEKCSNIVKYLIDNIETKCNYIGQETKVLDVGCAKGNFSNAFQQLGFLVTGIDCSEVAIEIAKKKFTKCTFKIMDGFNPDFGDEKFNIIFIRGFSGFNTHNIKFVENFVAKYCKMLTDDGILIIGYSSDFSGQEMKNETVNWSEEEIYTLISKVECELINIMYPDYESNKTLLTYKEKIYYYIILKK